MSREDDYLRHEIRRFLHRFLQPGQTPPDLREAEARADRSVERNDWRVRVDLYFHGTPVSHHVLIQTPAWFRPNELREFYDIRALTRFVERTWYQIIEDRAVEDQTRRYREAYEEARRADAPETAALYEGLMRVERHARRYHQYGRSPVEALSIDALNFDEMLIDAHRAITAAPPRTRQMTATEVRARERAMSDRMTRIERDMMLQMLHGAEALGYALASNGRSLGITPEAEAKGMILLKENLTPKQLKQYDEHKYFDVKGGQTGTTYRIHHGRQMNIHALNMFGNKKFGLCFLPQGNLCHGDTMLAQKLTLELQEDEALRIGNRF